MHTQYIMYNSFICQYLAYFWCQALRIPFDNGNWVWTGIVMWPPLLLFVCSYVHLPPLLTWPGSASWSVILCICVTGREICQLLDCWLLLFAFILRSGFPFFPVRAFLKCSSWEAFLKQFFWDKKLLSVSMGSVSWISCLKNWKYLENGYTEFVQFSSHCFPNNIL